MNRRKFISGLSGATMGLTALFASTAYTQDATLNDLNSTLYNEINVEDALLKSHDGIILHHGKVLLHVGEGYSRTVLENDIYTLKQAGLKVEVAQGGIDNQITPYFYSNQYPPRNYNDRNSIEMITTIIQAARQLNLIVSPSEPTSP